MNTFDLWLNQGTTFNITLTATNPTGGLLNLSGYTALGGVKYGYGATGYLLNLLPQIDPSLVSGLINISVQVPTGLPVTKGVYEIIAVNTGTPYNFKVIGGYANIAGDIATY